MSQNTDFYGYLPSRISALFGVIYFGLACLICMLQTIFGRYKHYWLFTIVVAATGETIGWAARLWAHSSPDDWMPYMIQLCSLIVTPVFISAADYVMLCKIIGIIDTRLFHVPKQWYWIGFVACDMISLAIQTVGGVEVSSAQDIQAISRGGRTMRAGIIFQFSNTIMFAALLLAGQFRVRQSTMIRLPAILALWISTGMLLLRNGYRIVELSGGWDGRIMRTESYLIGLDLIPMAIAVGAFVIFPPSWFLETKNQTVFRS